ncbi:MAG: type II secretion system protein [Desulforudis sp.]|jgi:prepilin-type N-terminal cleavage/methylation domain-containing protein|nr:MAG: type II secretion system protein [Desulforudis sp.]
MSFAGDRNQGAKGFTLLELMIALGIFAIVLVIITSVLSGHLRLFRQSNEERRHFHEARLAMEAITDALDKAREDGYRLELEAGGEQIVGFNESPDQVIVVSTTTTATVYLVKNELRDADGRTISRGISLELSPLTKADIQGLTFEESDVFSFIRIEIGAGDPTQSGYTLTTIVGTAPRPPL